MWYLWIVKIFSFLFKRLLLMGFLNISEIAIKKYFKKIMKKINPFAKLLSNKLFRKRVIKNKKKYNRKKDKRKYGN